MRQNGIDPDAFHMNVSNKKAITAFNGDGF